jgi:hypothetical protein
MPPTNGWGQRLETAPGFEGGSVYLCGRKGSSSVLIITAAFVLLLALELADRVTMKRDLEIAREIQRWLLPATSPEVAGFDLAFATRPANTVSGDYYDAFHRDGARAACC